MTKVHDVDVRVIDVDDKVLDVAVRIVSVDDKVLDVEGKRAPLLLQPGRRSARSGGCL
jgi:hypothetical protein